MCRVDFFVNDEMTLCRVDCNTATCHIILLNWYFHFSGQSYPDHHGLPSLEHQQQLVIIIIIIKHALSQPGGESQAQ